MGLSFSTAMRNAIVAALGDATFTGGRLQFRTGAKAASPGAAPSGTLVSEITLPADAFTDPAAGAVAKNGLWEDPAADAAGLIGHYRFLQNGDANAADETQERVEGTVTATGGGGDIEFDNPDVEAGQRITVNSYTTTQPAS